MSRKTAVACTIIFVLLLSTIFGCTGGTEPVTTPTTEAASMTPQEIAVKALDTANAKTYTFTMGMSMDMEISGGGEEPMKMTALVDMTGAADLQNREMQMNMNMSAEVPSQGTQNVSMDTYMVDGWMYMKMNLTGQGEQWTKTALTDEMWQSQNQLAQQLDLLQTAIDIKLAGSEVVNGVDCYILEITPDMNALADWVLSQQQGGGAGVDLEQVNLGDAFKQFAIKEWIAKDSFLLTKGDLSAVLEMTAGDMGQTTAPDDGKMALSMTAHFYCSNWNSPVSIVLPPEAANAQEMNTLE